MGKLTRQLFSRRSAKAWLSGAMTLVGALLMGNQDGVLDLNDYLKAIGATLASVAAVFGIPNAKMSSEEDGDDGAYDRDSSADHPA